MVLDWFEGSMFSLVTSIDSMVCSQGVSNAIFLILPQMGEFQQTCNMEQYFEPIFFIKY